MVEEYDGIDFSVEIINYCKKKFNYSNVHLYYQDLKRCKLNKTYDLIILPFNVINNFYSLHDLEKALGKLKKEKAVVANQCTCSNCNCNCKFSLNNNLDDLTKVYREKLA